MHQGDRWQDATAMTSTGEKGMELTQHDRMHQGDLRHEAGAVTDTSEKGTDLTQDAGMHQGDRWQDATAMTSTGDGRMISFGGHDRMQQCWYDAKEDKWIESEWIYTRGGLVFDWDHAKGDWIYTQGRYWFEQVGPNGKRRRTGGTPMHPENVLPRLKAFLQEAETRGFRDLAWEHADRLGNWTFLPCVIIAKMYPTPKPAKALAPSHP